MSEIKNIGDKIAILRKEKGLQQDEFADKIGVSRQALSQWETGKQIPRSDKILEICEQFGVTANYFYGNTEVVATEEKMPAEQPNTTALPAVGKEDSLVALSQSETNPKNNRITLAAAYELWRLVRGWIFVAFVIALGIGFFIIGISPNVNSTTVRAFIVDWTGVTVILIVALVVFIAAQTVRTVLYFSKRRQKKDEEK
ncbi:MAG: helix-turn-helix transcriptional regulator [Clostridia bacterium]|nr:helix-turn-helix transcriptional regulator [Clostridia bacterium]